MERGTNTWRFRRYKFGLGNAQCKFYLPKNIDDSKSFEKFALFLFASSAMKAIYFINFQLIFIWKVLACSLPHIFFDALDYGTKQTIIRTNGHEFAKLFSLK